MPAAVFFEYYRYGDRNNYEKLYFERRKHLASLVLGEVFDRKGRFMDQIINGIWSICEESFWGVPAHLYLQKTGPGLPDVNDPVVDLFAAETAAEMSWTYYLLKTELDKVSPLVTKRIQDEINKRIFVPYLNNDWAYLGFQWRKHPDSLRRVNNWNPWINSNVLTAALLLANDGQRNRIIHKTMQSITNFLEPFPADGGNDEGPQYWSRAAGSVLDYLELLKAASGGKIDVFGNPLIKRMGTYIYKVYIKDEYFFNYGDADAKIVLDPGLLYRFGMQIKDDTMVHFAAFMAKQLKYGQGTVKGEFGVLNRVLPGLHILGQLLETPAVEPLPADTWLPCIQVMTARNKAGSSEGLYLAVKGGNNGVSHNHNDAGNFVVYADGYPLLIDAGPQTYTSQTFSGKRYELWNNQSAYHNLPTINGVMQKEGSHFRASGVNYVRNNKQATLYMNIATAYPPEAEVVSWLRKLTLYRGQKVELTEKFKLRKYVQPTVENFITPLIPDTRKSGVVLLTDTLSGKKYRISYDKHKFSATTDSIVIGPRQGTMNATGGRMSDAWGNMLYRIRLILTTGSLQDDLSLTMR